MPLAPLLFTCSLVFDIYWTSFYRLQSRDKWSSSYFSSLGRHSDICSFCFGGFELLFATGSLGASNFVLVSYFKNIFCPPYIFAQVISFGLTQFFISRILFIFLCLISLISHYSYVFCVYSALSETDSSFKEYIVYATCQRN